MLFIAVSEVFVNIGEDITVPRSIKLTINCSLLIGTLVPFSNITWSRDGVKTTNGSITNMLINQNRHLLILSSTALSTGGRLGNGGTYACSVCSNNGTCIARQSHIEICRKFVSLINKINFNYISTIETPMLQKAATPITIIPISFGRGICGENLCIATFPIMPIILSCTVYASGPNSNTSVYKDNTYVNDRISIVLTNVTIPHSLGRYEFVLSDQCGTDTAISTLSLCGKPFILLIDSMNNFWITIKHVYNYVCVLNISESSCVCAHEIVTAHVMCACLT